MTHSTNGTKVRHQKRKNSSFKNLAKACVALLSIGLGGCMDLYEPSTINEAPIQVKEEAFLQDVPLDDVDDKYIRALAYHYSRYGASTMDLLVTYDPHSKDNTAMKATNAVGDIAETLRGVYDVTDVKAGIMPVASQHEAPRLLVSYDSYSAHAPQGCDGMMPGLDGRPMEDDSRYKLGCSIATLKARQVARPADLLGSDSVYQTTEGRSASNIVDLHRSGAEKPALQGESASEN
jgi:type IV pilus biogenesis protein CpaD/CtpE